MNYKDYYAALGVAKAVSQDEIQKAYRKLARKFHPDINKTEEAEGRFKEINEAYEVLKDPEKRSRYDQFGSAWKQAQRTGAPPAGFEDVFSQFGFGGAGGTGGGFGGRQVEFDLGGGDFSSFFELLFGGKGGPAQRPSGFRAAATRAAGIDLEARIAISLEEAGRGGKKEITLSDPATGKQRRLQVKLPSGIRPGKKLRLAGQGSRLPNGHRGDLYLTVEMLPHPNFRLDGVDLQTRLPVTPWEAALGSQAQITTLEGEVTVRIPPGSSSGRKIRLKGKGFPAGSGAHGDLYAEIRVVVPDELSDDDRRLFEELASTSTFRARPEPPVGNLGGA